MKERNYSLYFSPNKRGVSLIILVIMIIVMIILAATTLFILSETGVIERANEARFKSEFKSYAESLNVYISDKLLQDGTVNLDDINVALSVNGENVELKKIISNVKKDHIKYLSIEKGVLIFNIVDTTSKEDIKYGYWACQAGIKVKDFEECADVYNVDKTPYLIGDFVNGVCTPNLTGFNIAKTRYVSYTNLGEEIIGETIDKAPPENWYNYLDSEVPTNNKYATIVTENANNVTYLVWIPKYEYKKDTTGTHINYISRETIDTTSGYQIPEGFTWDKMDEDNEADRKIINLAGIWVSKYKLSLSDNCNTDFTYTVENNSVTVKVDTTVTGTLKYYYYISEEGDKPENKNKSASSTYTFTSLNTNQKTYKIIVQVYKVDESGNITSLAGECQKNVKIDKLEQPDFTGFNPDSTKYISYNANGEEIVENNLYGNAPSNWYNYGTNKLANIFVSSSHNASYLVWIPRYEYKTYSYGGNIRSDINYIQSTKTEPTPGYQIPEGFTWDMTDDSGSLINLKGIWVSKYKLSENDKYACDFTYKTYSDFIYIKSVNITTVVSSGTLKYTFYIAKLGEQIEKKEENTTGTYTFSGLTSGATYNVLVSITNIDESGNAISNLGIVDKNIYTYTPPDPILTGFESDNTKYVTWNEDGSEIEGNNISPGELPPDNWYDYQQNKLANIFTVNGNNKSYFAWIPRYEYKAFYIGANQVADINYIPATKTTPTRGFTIPEGFTWDMTDDSGGLINLAGIWVSKYKLSLNN